MSGNNPIRRMQHEEKVKVIHVCTQKENIEKLNLVILGNGHPEDGLAFKVLKMSEDIGEIKKGVELLHKRSEENKDIAKAAVHAVDEYKLECAAIDKTKDSFKKTSIEKRTEKRLEIQKNLSFFATVIMAIGLCITAYYSFFGSKSSKINETYNQTTEKHIHSLVSTVDSLVKSLDPQKIK